MGVIPEHEIVEIDASKFSVSGTSLRVALILSAITGRPFALKNINPEGRYPGLDASRLELIRLFAQGTQATVKGASVGSGYIEFVPTTTFAGGSFVLDFKNASPTTLPAYALLLTSLFCKKKSSFRFVGGTQVKDAPSALFLREFVQRYMYAYASKLQLSETAVGFFPQGGGELALELKGKYDLADLPPRLEVTRNEELVAVKVVLFASQNRLEHEVLERIRFLIETSLKELSVPIDVHMRYAQTDSSGASILLEGLFGNSEGYDNDFPYVFMVDKMWSALGDIPLQTLEDETVALCKEFQAVLATKQIDDFSVEFLLPLLAIVGGRVNVQKLTPRMEAIIQLCEYFLEIIVTKRAGVLETKGYVQRFRDELPDIEEL